ncbi:DUF4760 domain-containing protein [Kluyvera cryocrescens]|uniref:DUF4760 domain-containing protein n=1 Tax=Kluyvera cryocrescens TaxID=580 RepID=UPI002DB99F61|nr:DUF4760 domain-containing protein [Kluyvera cryocrescens]MEB7712773.1 DUF4760 domain-containing protein [Kluyvera cryocrescens]
MKYKWHLFWVIIAFCSLGTIGLALFAYMSEPPAGSSVVMEVMKTVFLCLGGIGVIMPLYINATSAVEGRTVSKIENTFRLIERWDDPHLFAARKFTRDIGEKRKSLSDKKLIKEIRSDNEVKQSVILVANYFEQVRFSLINDRIDAKQFKSALGAVVLQIIERFMPYFKTLSKQHVKDLKQLKKLLK